MAQGTRDSIHRDSLQYTAEHVYITLEYNKQYHNNIFNSYDGNSQKP